MRHLFIGLLSLILCLGAKAQMVNENGEKTYMANIAVVVNETMYNIDEGKMVEIDVQGREALKSALTLYLSQHFANNGFMIVNNNAEVNAKINAVIEENKLEEYIDGLAVQAKNVGAQFIALLDYTLYMENNMYVTGDFSFRYIDVNSNIGVHKYVSQQAVCYTPDELNLVAASLTKKFFGEFEDFFNSQYLPQFVVSEVKGKKTKLFATRPISMKGDETVNYYKWYYEPCYFQGQDVQFCTLDFLTTSAPLSKAKQDSQTGALQLKVEESITAKPEELLAVMDVEWFSVGTALTPLYFTFVELAYDENSMEGYARKSVNQAVYNALSNSPNHIMIIESDLLPELKVERERQKDEAFMYAENNTRKEYLDKFKTGTFGAEYLIDIENFKVDEKNWKKVSFTLNCHFVEKDAQHQSYEVSCHLSNIKEVVQYYINQYLMTPVSIASYDKKTLSIFTPLYVKANVGDIFHLYNYTEIVNPLTGEKTFQRTPVAEYEYLEWKGQKHVLAFKKVLNKDLFKKMDELKERDKESRANFSIFKHIEEPKKTDKDNSVFAKSEKAAKLMNALGGLQ